MRSFGGTGTTPGPRQTLVAIVTMAVLVATVAVGLKVLFPALVAGAQADQLQLPHWSVIITWAVVLYSIWLLNQYHGGGSS